MTSKKLKRSYKTLNYWNYKTRRAVWTELSQFNESDEDKQAQRDIFTKLYEIEALVEKLYGPKIGAAIMSEIRVSVK